MNDEIRKFIIYLVKVQEVESCFPHYS